MSFIMTVPEPGKSSKGAFGIDGGFPRSLNLRNLPIPLTMSKGEGTKGVLQEVRAVILRWQS